MYSWAKEISQIDTQVSSEGVKARTKGFQYAFAMMIGSRCVCFMVSFKMTRWRVHYLTTVRDAKDSLHAKYRLEGLECEHHLKDDKDAV